jgi:hypothetical protein
MSTTDPTVPRNGTDFIDTPAFNPLGGDPRFQALVKKFDPPK